MSKLIPALTILLLSFSACKKERVDASANTIDDIDNITAFESKIATGVALAFFHASWCRTCEEQRPHVESLAENSAADFAEIIELEYEDNVEVTEKYNVSGFPQILFFKDGIEKERLKGKGHTEEKLLSTLEKYK